MSINKAIIIGHLGADPELRKLPDGSSVATFSVATTENWKDKTTQEKKSSTEWHRINVFGRLAEVAGEYLKKGAQVYIEGKLTTQKWTDKDGIERYSTSIQGRSMQMLGKSEGNSSSRPNEPPAPNSTPENYNFDEDIPF